MGIEAQSILYNRDWVNHVMEMHAYIHTIIL